MNYLFSIFRYTKLMALTYLHGVQITIKPPTEMINNIKVAFEKLYSPLN